MVEMVAIARRLASCCIVAATIFCTLAGKAFAEPQPVVRFDAETPVTLKSGGTADVALFNDSARSFAIQATASLDPSSDQTDGKRVSVAIAFDIGSGFSDRATPTTLRFASRMRLRLTAPSNAPPGATGWLTVVATSDAQTVVARREIHVATPAPTVETWTVTSVQKSPWHDRGGDIAPPLPLLPKTGCSGLGNPHTVLVSADHTVSITSRCVRNNLQLTASNFPPGTYKGKLAVGGASVGLEVRRTMTLWWPIALIILGILLAVVSQGRVDQGWRIQQRFWLRRLPPRAAKADTQYVVGAREMPWEKYALEPIIEEEVEAARESASQIAESLPLPLRFLPWPEGFRATERAEVRKSIAEMDKMVTQWPTMPPVFRAASEALAQESYYVKRAPELVARGLVIVGAAGLPVDGKELAARAAEAAALPTALGVVDDLEKIAEYLKALEADGVDGPAQDLDARVRARQYERQASATLAELSDATKVQSKVEPLIERAARLAARLPRPGGIAADGEQVAIQTGRLATAVSLPLALIRRVSALLDGAGFYLGRSTLIVFDLAVGVLSGLAILYFEKAWGRSWTDYVAAVLWGYAASTVTSPIVATVRQLGAQPGDEAASAQTK